MNVSSDDYDDNDDVSQRSVIEGRQACNVAQPSVILRPIRRLQISI